MWGFHYRHSAPLRRRDAAFTGPGHDARRRPQRAPREQRINRLARQLRQVQRHAFRSAIRPTPPASSTSRRPPTRRAHPRAPSTGSKALAEILRQRKKTPPPYVMQAERAAEDRPGRAPRRARAGAAAAPPQPSVGRGARRPSADRHYDAFPPCRRVHFPRCPSARTTLAEAAMTRAIAWRTVPTTRRSPRCAPSSAFPRHRRASWANNLTARAARQGEPRAAARLCWPISR